MKILVAMDSLKGSLTSLEANEAIAEGLALASEEINVVTVPIADGGEGTIDALVHATGGHFVEARVTGPLGELVNARYGILGGSKIAVIEIAEACGLPLLTAEQRDPRVTTSFGVGELILEAADKGCTEFIIGLGGSATNDAGVGMLQALGYRFLNREGEEVGFGGAELINLEKINEEHVPKTVKNLKLRVACDVTNPLYGENGAAYIYGPQKGATEEDVPELDRGLKHFAKVVLKQKGLDLQTVIGGGAAGGLGAAIAGFLNANLESGVQMILEQARLGDKLEGVDLVITGEGRLDAQTSMGKAPAGISQLAKSKGIPAIALAGDVSQATSALHESGIIAYFPIVSGPTNLESAMKPEITYTNLKRTSEQIGRLLLLGR